MVSNTRHLTFCVGCFSFFLFQPKSDIFNQIVSGVSRIAYTNICYCYVISVQMLATCALAKPSTTQLSIIYFYNMLLPNIPLALALNGIMPASFHKYLMSGSRIRTTSSTNGSDPSSTSCTRYMYVVFMLRAV